VSLKLIVSSSSTVLMTQKGQRNPDDVDVGDDLLAS
jgi:hypothetical protein